MLHQHGREAQAVVWFAEAGVIAAREQLVGGYVASLE
jgi:hypothetical protein